MNYLTHVTFKKIPNVKIISEKFDFKRGQVGSDAILFIKNL